MRDLKRFKLIQTGCSLILIFFSACTNYSSDQQIVNAPILLSVATEDTGHILTVAAQNIEIGFLGYRLYEGSSEDGVRATATDQGVDCGPFTVQPNASIEYVIEIKPGQTTVTPGLSNRVCAFSGSLTSGHYIGVRALIFSLTSVGTSDISNVILIP